MDHKKVNFNTLTIDKVTAQNLQIYLNLCQAYEGEFSALTEKLPDAKGLFALDTILDIAGGNEGTLGYLMNLDGRPVGMAAIKLDRAKLEETECEVCEFYIIPSQRKHGLGQYFASSLFKQHPGHWQIKQIEGADAATQFWRRVVSVFTRGCFEEQRMEDPYWGSVTCQLFESK